MFSCFLVVVSVVMSSSRTYWLTCRNVVVLGADLVRCVGCGLKSGKIVQIRSKYPCLFCKFQFWKRFLAPGDIF